MLSAAKDLQQNGDRGGLERFSVDKESRLGEVDGEVERNVDICSSRVRLSWCSGVAVVEGMEFKFLKQRAVRLRCALRVCVGGTLVPENG